MDARGRREAGEDADLWDTQSQEGEPAHGHGTAGVDDGWSSFASSAQRLWHQAKRVTFGVLYVMAKEQEHSKPSVVATTFVAFFQLLAFAFDARFNAWGGSAIAHFFGYFFGVFNVVHFAAHYASDGVLTFFVRASYALVFACLAVAVYVGRCFLRNDYPLIWPIKVLRSAAAALATVLAVPLITLLTMVHCAPTARSEAICYGRSFGLVDRVLGSLGLALLIPMALLARMTYFDPNPRSKLLNARVSSRAETSMLLLELFLIGGFVVFPRDGSALSNPVLSIGQFAGSCLLLSLFLLRQPFYSAAMNHLTSGLSAIMVLASSFALLSLLRAEDTGDERELLGSLFLVLAPPCFWMGWRASAAVSGFFYAAPAARMATRIGRALRWWQTLVDDEPARFPLYNGVASVDAQAMRQADLGAALHAMESGAAAAPAAGAAIASRRGSAEDSGGGDARAEMVDLELQAVANASPESASPRSPAASNRHEPSPRYGGDGGASQTSSVAPAAVRGAYCFFSPLDVELCTRFLQCDSSPAAVEAAAAIYVAGMQRFPHCASLLFHHAQFLSVYRQDALALRQTCAKLLKGDPELQRPVEIYFFAFRGVQNDRRQMGSAKISNGRDVDLVAYIELQKNLTASRQDFHTAVAKLQEFWQSLLPDVVDLVALDTLVREIVGAQQRAEFSFMQLLDRFPKSPPILREYGRFLAVVKNSPERADEMFRRADLEDSRQAMAKTDAAAPEANTGNRGSVSMPLQPRVQPQPQPLPTRLQPGGAQPQLQVIDPEQDDGSSIFHADSAIDVGGRAGGRDSDGGEGDGGAEEKVTAEPAADGGKSRQWPRPPKSANTKAVTFAAEESPDMSARVSLTLEALRHMQAARQHFSIQRWSESLSQLSACPHSPVQQSSPQPPPPPPVPPSVSSPPPSGIEDAASPHDDVSSARESDRERGRARVRERLLVSGAGQTSSAPASPRSPRKGGGAKSSDRGLASEDGTASESSSPSATSANSLRHQFQAAVQQMLAGKSGPPNKGIWRLLQLMRAVLIVVLFSATVTYLINAVAISTFRSSFDHLIASNDMQFSAVDGLRNAQTLDLRLRFRNVSFREPPAFNASVDSSAVSYPLHWFRPWPRGYELVTEGAESASRSDLHKLADTLLMCNEFLMHPALRASQRQAFVSAEWPIVATNPRGGARRNMTLRANELAVTLSAHLHHLSDINFTTWAGDEDSLAPPTRARSLERNTDYDFVKHSSETAIKAFHSYILFLERDIIFFRDAASINVIVVFATVLVVLLLMGWLTIRNAINFIANEKFITLTTFAQIPLHVVANLSSLYASYLEDGTEADAVAFAHEAQAQAAEHGGGGDNGHSGGAAAGKGGHGGRKRKRRLRLSKNRQFQMLHARYAVAFAVIIAVQLTSMVLSLSMLKQSRNDEYLQHNSGHLLETMGKCVFYAQEYQARTMSEGEARARIEEALTLYRFARNANVLGAVTLEGEFVQGFYGKSAKLMALWFGNVCETTLRNCSEAEWLAGEFGLDHMVRTFDSAAVDFLANMHDDSAGLLDANLVAMRSAADGPMRRALLASVDLAKEDMAEFLVETERIQLLLFLLSLCLAAVLYVAVFRPVVSELTKETMYSTHMLAMIPHEELQSMPQVLAMVGIEIDASGRLVTHRDPESKAAETDAALESDEEAHSSQEARETGLFSLRRPAWGRRGLRRFHLTSLREWWADLRIRGAPGAMLGNERQLAYALAALGLLGFICAYGATRGRFSAAMQDFPFLALSAPLQAVSLVITPWGTWPVMYVLGEAYGKDSLLAAACNQLVGSAVLLSFILLTQGRCLCPRVLYFAATSSVSTVFFSFYLDMVGSGFSNVLVGSLYVGLSIGALLHQLGEGDNYTSRLGFNMRRGAALIELVPLAVLGGFLNSLGGDGASVVYFMFSVLYSRWPDHLVLSSLPFIAITSNSALLIAQAALGKHLSNDLSDANMLTTLPLLVAATAIAVYALRASIAPDAAVVRRALEVQSAEHSCLGYSPAGPAVGDAKEQPQARPSQSFVGEPAAAAAGDAKDDGGGKGGNDAGAADASGGAQAEPRRRRLSLESSRAPSGPEAALHHLTRVTHKEAQRERETLRTLQRYSRAWMTFSASVFFVATLVVEVLPEPLKFAYMSVEVAAVVATSAYLTGVGGGIRARTEAAKSSKATEGIELIQA